MNIKDEEELEITAGAKREVEKLARKNRHQTWVISGVALLAAIIFAIQVNASAHKSDQRRQDREQQIALVEQAACNNFNTIRTILISSSTPTELYRKIGFNEEQIASIDEQVTKSRTQSLEILGARPADCLPTKALAKLELGLLPDSLRKEDAAAKLRGARQLINPTTQDPGTPTNNPTTPTPKPRTTPTPTTPKPLPTPQPQPGGVSLPQPTTPEPSSPPTTTNPPTETEQPPSVIKVPNPLPALPVPCVRLPPVLQVDCD